VKMVVMAEDFRGALVVGLGGGDEVLDDGLSAGDVAGVEVAADLGQELDEGVGLGG